jgi:hypothetical protein
MHKEAKKCLKMAHFRMNMQVYEWICKNERVRCWRTWSGFSALYNEHPIEMQGAEKIVNKTAISRFQC